MNLSDHFTLYEMTRSQTACRHGIDNTPSDDDIQKLKRLCQHILEPIREHFKTPFRPNSGYRCLELNTLLGSQPTSQHVAAEAVDIEISGIDNCMLAKWIRDELNFDQLILENYESGEPSSGWVHVSLKENNIKNRFQVLTIKDGVKRHGLCI